MQYFIERREGFEADITRQMDREQEDLTKVYGKFSEKEYLHRSVNPPKRVKKRVYWQISEKLPVLYKIYKDSAFKELKEEMRAQSWIVDLAAKKINDFPRNITPLFFDMIKSSPSFFEVMLRHETFSQLKNQYSHNFNAANVLGLTDAGLVNSWFLYLVCLGCYDRDEDRGYNTDASREILKRLVDILGSKEPQMQQGSYMRHLESVISAIELTLPNWDKVSHKALKRAVRRNIADFRQACAREKESSPRRNMDPMNSEYAMLYHQIIWDLIDEREGSPG
jgi:hypothetical protein